MLYLAVLQQALLSSQLSFLNLKAEPFCEYTVYVCTYDLLNLKWETVLSFWSQ